MELTEEQDAIGQSARLREFYRLRRAGRELHATELLAQQRLLVDRVMSEAGLYAPSYAALALKQAEGDPTEAVFLLRAYRSTLARNHCSNMVDMKQMRVIRRISSSFSDIPGGQLLGPTADYAHRLLDFSLWREDGDAIRQFVEQFVQQAGTMMDESEVLLVLDKVTERLRTEGLVATPSAAEEIEPFDITRSQLSFPAVRSARLQTLARGETGAMTALAYSSMRGFGGVHPTIGQLSVGYAPLYVPHPHRVGEFDEEDSVYIGEVMLTEVETINSFTHSGSAQEPQFALGYGVSFGQNELKAIAMSILERTLETEGNAPAQDEEFVLLHIDSVEAGGYLAHLKLPHYITYQSKLDRLRRAKMDWSERQNDQTEAEGGYDGDEGV